MWRFVLLTAFSATLVSGRRTNDWTKPCFHGECAYDLPESVGAGAIKITGSPNVIKDISPAAGWIILSCDPQLLKQDIRLVCENDAADASPCNHLFDHGGPVNKLVRLPESCGRGPFARIAEASVATDQSVPDHVTGKLKRRGVVLPKVHILSIDTDFEKIDTARWGNIFFTATATSASGSEAELYGSDAIRARSATIHKASNTTNSSGKVLPIPEKAKSHPKSFNLITESNQVAYSKSRTMMSQSMQCGSKKSSLRIDAGNGINGTIYTGFTASGTIAPPQITNFSSYVEFSGNASARFEVVSSLKGTVSRYTNLLHQDIKPIRIPGILELYPSFDVSARIEAQIDIPASVNLTMNFDLDDVQMWYPPQTANDPVMVNLTDSHVNISFLNNSNGRTDITGHVEPNIHLRVEAFDGKSQADVQLNMDLYSKVGINVPEPPTVRGLKGYTGVNGGIVLSGSTQGGFFGISDQPRNVSLYEHEWVCLCSIRQYSHPVIVRLRCRLKTYLGQSLLATPDCSARQVLDGKW